MSSHPTPHTPHHAFNNTPSTSWYPPLHIMHSESHIQATRTPPHRSHTTTYDTSHISNRASHYTSHATIPTFFISHLTSQITHTGSHTPRIAQNGSLLERPLTSRRMSSGSSSASPDSSSRPCPLALPLALPRSCSSEGLRVFLATCVSPVALHSPLSTGNGGAGVTAGMGRPSRLREYWVWTQEHL